jgi:flagellar basal body P-ring formation protein FlgA
MIVRSFLLLFSVLVPMVGNHSHASTKPEDIQARVSTYMNEYREQLMVQYGPSVRIEYEISNVDPRLSMADCEQPLTVKLKAQSKIGRANLKVSCFKGSAWSIYVPATIKLYRKVVVTTMPIARQAKLSEAALELQERDVSTLRGTYFTAMEKVQGMQARRPLQPGSPVLANQIEPPIMIKRGESVLMSASSGSLQVKIPAKALMDGRIGDQISVQNRQSKRVVEAKVVGPGHVVVPM